MAATNVNLTQAISEGRFREDLYYRLNTVPIQIPPLRERGEDAFLLFRKFASDFAEKYRMPAIQLTEDAKQLLFLLVARQRAAIEEYNGTGFPSLKPTVKSMLLY